MRSLRLTALATVATLALASPARAQKTRTIDECIAASEKAQVDRTAGQLRSARDAAHRCLDTRCPAPIRKDCDAWATELERAIPTILYRVRDARDADVIASTISVDGVPVPNALDGRAHEIDPGAHEVEARAAGFETSRVRVVIEEGVRPRTIELRLSGVDPSMAPRVAVVARPFETRRPTTATWIATGTLAAVALGGLVMFAGVGLSADADFRALEKRCNDGCSRDDTDSVRTRFQVADVALGVGLVALAAAAVVYILGPRTGPTDIHRER